MNINTEDKLKNRVKRLGQVIAEDIGDLYKLVFELRDRIEQLEEACRRCQSNDDRDKPSGDTKEVTRPGCVKDRPGWDYVGWVAREPVDRYTFAEYCIQAAHVRGELRKVDLYPLGAAVWCKPDVDDEGVPA